MVTGRYEATATTTFPGGERPAAISFRLSVAVGVNGSGPSSLERMCGIAGLWDVSDQGVADMLVALRHRGPDGHGAVQLGDGRALGHQRLSIVDLENGAQPFVQRASDGTVRCLVANGEIYNAAELRDGLDEAAFASTSDSEVILHLLDGDPHAVDQLHGMFAFALVDDGELVLGRDPLGIKPLYVGSVGGGTVFASELKALPGGTTDVRALTPGTTVSSVEGERRYAAGLDTAIAAAGSIAFDDAKGLVRSTLEQAVVDRLMADVPVGAFLSGGLDSSAICALMREHVDELHTFTVGLEGSPDLRAARLVAEHLGTIHHEHVLTADEVAGVVPDVVVSLESFDLDLVRSAVPTWFVSRLAAEHVKVVLTGEGADELFAGYEYHKDITDPVTLQDEAHRSIGELHHVNLQRVDRMTMAHSLEARVPFLDTRMIALALSLPPELRMPTVGEIEKTLLRAAVEDLLPSEVVWRDKAQFDQGSGTADLLPTLEHLSDGLDLVAYRALHPGTDLRSVEECGYHRMLATGVAHPDVVLPTVARWADRPAA
ncbi:asparagine synthase B [soil metagenome]